MADLTDKEWAEGLREKLHSPTARFWRVRQAAQSLAISERKARILIEDGRLRAVRFGGSLRVTDEELDRFAREEVTPHQPKDATPPK